VGVAVESLRGGVGERVLIKTELQSSGFEDRIALI
jgi:hypothetical protein